MTTAEKVAAELLNRGWKTHSDGFRIMAETGGAFGQAYIFVRIDESGRWFERVNGWGQVEKDLDLRAFSDAPDAAIDSLTRG